MADGAGNRPVGGRTGTRAKRILDLAVALPGIVLLSPVFVLVAVLGSFRLGRPILFRQARPGIHGRPFILLKFRTMRDLRGSQGELLPDAVRLTSFGRFLRRTSLDELPELINVLKGEMSIVGPRPLLLHYLDLYTPEQARRHEVKPGLTGWAQVNGRNAITWEEKFDLDVWYVDNRSFMLDLRIMSMTVAKVLKGEGISASGAATMPEFTGTPSREAVERNA
jgi:sugar transferase EpsL